VYTQVHQPQSHTTVDEQKVYDHLLHCVRSEAPEAVIQRFYALFVNNLGYPDPEIRAALKTIVMAKSARQDFPLFINRCCYILVNRWQAQSEGRAAISQFTQLLGRASSLPAGLGRAQASTRLRTLVQHYTQSEYYQRLRRFSDFLNPNTGGIDTQPLSNLLRRYPYLYQHCLVSQEDSPTHQQTIRQVQAQAQQKYTQDLSLYLTHACIQAARSPAQMSLPVGNPTLLSNQELLGTVKQFVGKVDRQGSYQDMAQSFLRETDLRHSTYQVFKHNLYEYLIASVDPKFGQHRFNVQLHDYLNLLYPECHEHPMSDFLLTRTCSRVMNFMVIDSSKKPNHWVFMDLLNNIGSTQTIGLLLKVLLICKKVKPYLERRFAILFNHYESQQRSAVQWLVHCFEKVNLAWSTHFSAIDFSFVTVL
jgi:hypothetical protein